MRSLKMIDSQKKPPTNEKRRLDRKSLGTGLAPKFRILADFKILIAKGIPSQHTRHPFNPGRFAFRLACQFTVSKKCWAPPTVRFFCLRGVRRKQRSTGSGK